MNKMKMWKRIFTLTMLAAILLSLVGCGAKKEALTTKQFKRFMEEKGFTVLDQTEAMDNSDYQDHFVATDIEKYSFEYCFMRNTVTAKSLYDVLVERVKANYEDTSGFVTMEQSFNSYADCFITAPDYYFKIIRVEKCCALCNRLF